MSNSSIIHIKVLGDSNIFPKELLDEIEKSLGAPTVEQVPNYKSELKEKPQEKIKYNFDMVSTSLDLKELTKKLKNSKEKKYSILLYGEPGTGKTFYGNYLAQQLGMNVLKKKAGDMLSRFVGESEKQIQEAFEEAVSKNAILILDECDSLLTDRSKAKQDFQVSSVNTMLTCMENHPLPFICSTNLKEWLDKASMRRFVFKIKYDEMNTKNIKAGIKEYFGKTFGIKDEDLQHLKHITAGDFPLIKKKIDILENKNYTKQNIIHYLEEEQKEKGIIDYAKKIGF